jgi:hypothetical protein
MLADSVCMYNALDQASFYLQVYILFKIGNTITIKKILNMKGHNIFFPC